MNRATTSPAGLDASRKWMPCGRIAAVIGQRELGEGLLHLVVAALGRTQLRVAPASVSVPAVTARGSPGCGGLPVEGQKRPGPCRPPPMSLDARCESRQRAGV